ncbi:MAG: hypothetical protein P4L46_13465 [Fimbriimonas sp.]|nr:hypothetical protein [Fimbriimonas sp.]
MASVGIKAKGRVTRLINAGWVIGCIVALPPAYNYLKGYVASDPFNTLFSKGPSDIDDSIGVRMNGVEMRDYSGSRLVGSAHARRVDIRKDRQYVDLYDVTNGVYHSDRGQFTYSAVTAIWNVGARLLIVNKKLTVHNKDMDLKANGLTFEGHSGTMTINGAVSGRLYQGQILAASVRYNVDSREAEAGPVDWVGKIDLGQETTAQSGPRQWKIHGAHSKVSGDIAIYEKATASDGDLIVSAPIVEHNRKTDVLNASGGIQYYSAKADILADKCIIYRKEKRTVLSGHVTMFVKPKSAENDEPKVEKLPDFKPVSPEQVVASHVTPQPDKEAQKSMEEEIRSSKNLREFPMVVVASQIEYWYAKGSRHAIITGDPQGRQTLKGDEWRHLWTHEAFYDGENDKLKLVSSERKKDTLMKNSLGDFTKAIDITVSTKEDDDEMDCDDPEGVINTFDDEIPRDDKKQDGKGVPPPVKGGSGGGLAVASA